VKRGDVLRRMPGATPGAWARWSGFWRRWWAYTTAAECLGFAVPALVGLTAWRLGFAPLPFFLALVIAGIAEGAVLGVGQQRALGRVLPVGAWRWPAWTAVGAGIAWAIGMLPSTLIDVGVPVWIALTIFAPLAPVLLLSIGTAQWVVLRHHLPLAAWWIPANAAAWLIALPPTFIAPALVPDGASLGILVAAWLTAGLVMAATVAALTGLAMVWLLDQGRSGQPEATAGRAAIGR
jgi:hypothetical protein